nr:hypothetical protein 36 [bacterium]
MQEQQFTKYRDKFIAEIEYRAEVAGLTMGEACKRAGIHLSTFHRWKIGEISPRLMFIDKLMAVLPEVPLKGGINDLK